MCSCGSDADLKSPLQSVESVCPLGEKKKMSCEARYHREHEVNLYAKGEGFVGEEGDASGRIIWDLCKKQVGLHTS